MSHRLVTRPAFLVAAGCALVAPAAARGTKTPERDVTLTASDGVQVFGIGRAPSAPRAIILLFHQADSSADEYDPIAPRLVELGYATLAVDQRSGGTMYGRNETVDRRGASTGWLGAERDLEAALRWARKTYPSLPVLAWGSSYSASLAFVLAANNRGEIDKLLAFSPGEYFDGQLSVAEVAKRVTAPIFADTAPDPDEVRAAKAILDASPSTVKVQYRPRHGVHGSSTLRKDRDPEGYEENWSAVEAFLRR